MLASCACRVQRSFKQDVEDELLQRLEKWQSGSADERLRLGDPGTIVLESKLVLVLAERLRAAPWTVLTTQAGLDDRRANSTVSALLLLRTLFAVVLDGGAAAAAGSSGQPNAEVLQTLLQQVWRLSCRMQ